MTGWHPYPRYFVLPDRSWRGVAFIDDPLDQDGVYIGQSGGDAPDWRDHDETERNLYSDGVHRQEYEWTPGFREKPLNTADYLLSLEHKQHLVAIRSRAFDVSMEGWEEGNEKFRQLQEDLKRLRHA